MPRYAVGAQVPLPFTVKNELGVLVDAATQVITVVQPDGTPATPTVTHPGLGTYIAYFTVTQPGWHSWSAATTSPTTVTPPDAFTAGAVTDAPLVGLADLREFLRTSSTITDAQLLTFGQDSTDAVERYTQRHWRRATVVEKHNGGKTAIILREAPLISVTTVVENGVTLTASDYTPDTNSGIVFRGQQQAVFPWLWGWQNITITYLVGPAGGIVPDNLLLGVKEHVRALWDSQRGGSGLPGQQAGEQQWVERNGVFITPRVASLWDPYVGPGGMA
jgi:hypothetical protein